MRKLLLPLSSFKDFETAGGYPTFNTTDKGIAVRVVQLIIQGAAPTAALAIILDALIGGVESWITPRGLKVLKAAQWQQ